MMKLATRIVMMAPDGGNIRVRGGVMCATAPQQPPRRPSVP